MRGSSLAWICLLVVGSVGCGQSAPRDPVDDPDPPSGGQIEVYGLDVYQHRLEGANGLIVEPSMAHLPFAEKVWREECHIQLTGVPSAKDPHKLAGYSSSVPTSPDIYLAEQFDDQLRNFQVLWPVRERLSQPFGVNAFYTLVVHSDVHGFNSAGTTINDLGGVISNLSAVINVGSGAFKITLAHEIGHQLNLDHGGTPGDLMFANGSEFNTSIDGYLSGTVDPVPNSDCDKARVFGQDAFFFSGVQFIDPPHGS